jgi:hypothetical protein
MQAYLRDIALATNGEWTATIIPYFYRASLSHNKSPNGAQCDSPGRKPGLAQFAPLGLVAECGLCHRSLENAWKKESTKSVH